MNQFKLLLVVMLLLCAHLPSKAFQVISTAYDLAFIGIDSDIDNRTSDAILLLNSKEINPNFSFGICDAILSKKKWKNHNTWLDYINLKYIGSEAIKKGSIIQIDVTTEHASVTIGESDVTNLFEINYNKQYDGDFITDNKWHLTVYSGSMVQTSEKPFLLGSTLDILAQNLTPQELAKIIPPAEFRDKQFSLESTTETSTHIIDYDNCELCELLATILFSDNWLNPNGSFDFDIDISEIEITDCITESCSGDLVIDKLDCNTITAISTPCTNIKRWRWTEIRDGQPFTIASGTDSAIENLPLVAVGLYQLTIECKNGCIYSSNLFYPDCYEDPCDIEVQVSTDMCTLTAYVSGCEKPEFQWYIQTADGTFIVSGATSSTLEATENGMYYVEVANCGDCVDVISTPIEMDCGVDCNCPVDLSIVNCEIVLTDSECAEYELLLEYYLKNTDTWIIVSQPIFPYFTEEFGNGIYRLTYSSSDCDDLVITTNIECQDSCVDCDDCIDCNDPCDIVPYLSLDGCSLQAIVLNCDEPLIQWQQYQSNQWANISGETGSTFNITEDGTYRYVVDGCGCTNDIYTSAPYTSDCYGNCLCDITMSLDMDCNINANFDNCGLLESLQWYYFNDDQQWSLLPQYDGNSISPNQNGLYKLIATTNNCGQIEEEIQVTCIDECQDLDVWFTTDVSCVLRVNWSGCYNLENLTISYLESESPLAGCQGNFEQIDIAASTIQEGSNPLNGTGYIELQPLGTGCYQVSLTCNDNCDPITVTETYEECCSEHATIEYTDSGIEVCDYCFPNSCTDSLFNIYVTIDGASVPLSSYTDYFTFPYCEGQSCDDGGSAQDCGDMPTFDILVQNINAWFAAFGYQGTAHLGGDTPVCRGEYAPFWIEQSEIEFDFGFIWEGSETQTLGYQNISFLEGNCNGDEGAPHIYASNACQGASYQWSTGATSSHIPYQEGATYSVTITCPDGCEVTISYPDNGLNSIQTAQHDPIFVINKENNDKVRQRNSDNRSSRSLHVFPNPTRNNVKVEFAVNNDQKCSVNLYSSDGSLVSKKETTASNGINQVNLDLTVAKSGLYFIEVRLERRSLYGKVVVNK